MFLYGMESMADGLQKFAGNRLQRVLEILTSNRLLGVLVGAGVTAIIQSSSATTVMVVGFVNAGIINLLQATGIIMGASLEAIFMGISAVGGMVYITTIAGCVWNHEGLSGVGWLAVALVIFCLWRPLSAIWGSVLFGALMILYLRLTIPFIPTQLYKILPYVVTLVVLIIVSLRKKREDQPPTSLGLNYFREDR